MTVHQVIVTDFFDEPNVKAENYINLLKHFFRPMLPTSPCDTILLKDGAPPPQNGSETVNA